MLQNLETYREASRDKMSSIIAQNFEMQLARFTASFLLKERYNVEPMNKLCRLNIIQLTCRIRCSALILCVQMISGVSESDIIAAAKAAGPLLSNTYNKDSGRRPPSTLLFARGKEEDTAASSPPWNAWWMCVTEKSCAIE